ncbi:MAG: hypothetical protein HUJ28_00905 [Chromatiales bacterium]|nr:hypothetical protein [Chromatiales bacterium]
MMLEQRSRLLGGFFVDVGKILPMVIAWSASGCGVFSCGADQVDCVSYIWVVAFGNNDQGLAHGISTAPDSFGKTAAKQGE